MQSRPQPNEPGVSRDRSYPRHRRIRKRKEYLRIQQGSRGLRERRTRHFIVILTPGPEPECRLGVTVSRKVGCAVQRNRVKRRVREFFRLYRHELQPAHDLLVIARPGAEELSFEDVEIELAKRLDIVVR